MTAAKTKKSTEIKVGDIIRPYADGTPTVVRSVVVLGRLVHIGTDDDDFTLHTRGSVLI